MRWDHNGTPTDDPEQVVLEAEPYRRLSFMWHAMTPELAATLDITDDARERIAAEPRSKATFEIEPLGDVVKLTVVHDGFGPDSLMAAGGGRGSPRGLPGVHSAFSTGGAPPPPTRPPPPPP